MASKDSDNLKPIRRRQFVQQAAASATVAAAGLSSLAPSSIAAQPAREQWDDEADVIVVGTGAAGYAAAIEAKDAGATVLMIDKAKWFGGRTIHSNGDLQMPASHVQKKAGIEDRVEWAVEDYYANGEHRGVSEVLRVFVENAADTALWLEKLGIVWNPTPKMQTPDCRVPRTISPAASPTYTGAAGISLIDVFNQNAVKRQIAIKLEHKLLSLLRPDPRGPVRGIQVQHGDRTLNFRARRGVVLATGGYNANHRMLRASHPLLDEPWNWAGAPYTQNTGDAHLASMRIGAGLADASSPPSLWMIFGSSQVFMWEPQTPDTPFGRAGLPFPGRNNAGILIENDGRRFVNEYTFNGNAEVTHPGVQAFLNLPERPRNVWAIVDSAGAHAINWKHEQFTDPAAQKNPYIDPKLIATAGSLDELAARMTIPGDNLRATIARYNLLVDADFGRPKPYLPIATPPFYAAKMSPLFADQSSGIRVNTKMQVIDQAFQVVDSGASPSVPIDREAVVPRLYGAGEFTGGMFGAARGHGKLGSYIVQGRVAGQGAAAERHGE
jgi:succinate dehydrogenase/fumarate reductase flavoprotein subunit